MSILLIGYEGRKYKNYPTSWGAAAYVEDGYLVNGLTNFKLKYDPSNISGGSSLTIFDTPIAVRFRPGVVVEMSTRHASAVGLLDQYPEQSTDGWKKIGEDQVIFYFASSAIAKEWRIATAAKLDNYLDLIQHAAGCLDHRLVNAAYENK